MSENVDWDGDLAYEATAHRVRAPPLLCSAPSSLAVALTGEAASDGSVAFGVNLNFSLDPRAGSASRGGRSPRPARSTPSSIATSTTMAFATADEPTEKDAVVTTGTQQADKPTNSKARTSSAG